jgi:hypothetical protein
MYIFKSGDIIVLQMNRSFNKIRLILGSYNCNQAENKMHMKPLKGKLARLSQFPKTNLAGVL